MAYFDLQVNGYGGVDFNQDTLTAQQLQTACEKLVADGVAGILATVITDDLTVMAHRLANLARLREEVPLARELIAGFHIEGPFLSPEVGYRGAHPLDAIRTADVDDMRRLLDSAAGLVRLVTLAPECDPGFAVTRMLSESGIAVSAGHCNPTLDQLEGAVDAGLSMFTHLGNGCPMQMHRHDNIVQRALSLADRLWICFIADEVHVAFPALGNYIRSAGANRCIAVTDAIAPAGMGPGLYTLSRWELSIGEDMVARAPDGSHLVGSAITMPQTASNLARNCRLTPEQAVRMTWDNPRKALGLPVSASLDRL